MAPQSLTVLFFRRNCVRVRFCRARVRAVRVPTLLRGSLVVRVPSCLILAVLTVSPKVTSVVLHRRLRKKCSFLVRLVSVRLNPSVSLRAVTLDVSSLGNIREVLGGRALLLLVWPDVVKFALTVVVAVVTVVLAG